MADDTMRKPGPDQGGYGGQGAQGAQGSQGQPSQGQQAQGQTGHGQSGGGTQSPGRNPQPNDQTARERSSGMGGGQQDTNEQDVE